MSDKKKVSTTVYLEQEQLEMLRELHSRTKVPVAEYIRQGVTMILNANQDKLPGQLKLVD
ncbi:ribbon-helix-helix domain-containing protein [Myxococcota bacterium]|nr:ribbon-helix-helix domain-containing protein [Myxococcota bacterium]